MRLLQVSHKDRVGALLHYWGSTSVVIHVAYAYYYSTTRGKDAAHVKYQTNPRIFIYVYTRLLVARLYAASWIAVEHTVFVKCAPVLNLPKLK